MSGRKQRALYSIGAASRRAGVSEHAIRVWEHRYGAVEPLRSGGNHRRYSEAQVRRLWLLRTAQSTGSSIAEIARMSDEELESLVTSIGEARGQGVAATVVACNDAVDRLDPWCLTDTLRTAIGAYGYVAVVDGVLGPVMRRVGDRWQAGQCGPEHEHLASATFRTFLGAALTSQTAPPSSPTLVAATFESEHHEFGTLAAAVVAGVEGWRVAYLGPNSPPDGIAHVAAAHAASAIAIGMTCELEDDYLRRALAELEARREVAPPIICGGIGAARARTLITSRGAMVVASVRELAQRLNEVRNGGAQL